jgi:AcrR family transcriptional regulator
MPRPPSQDRSRARVERVLLAAADLLAEADAADKITVRALAVRSGVSIGTIYQFFEDIDAVRLAVVERTRGDLETVLETELTEAAARASPGGFFCQLIDVILDLQRRHPHIGCLVEADRSDGFRGAFALELRNYVADHVRKVFACAFPEMDAHNRASKLEVALAALLGALKATPPRDDSERSAHLQQAKDLVSLYANAAFVAVKNMAPVRTRSRRK